MSRRGLDPVSRKTKTPGGRKKSGFCVYLAYQLFDNVSSDQMVGEAMNRHIDIGLAFIRNIFVTALLSSARKKNWNFFLKEILSIFFGKITFLYGLFSKTLLFEYIRSNIILNKIFV
jgi:hypothetical protein